MKIISIIGTTDSEYGGPAVNLYNFDKYIQTKRKNIDLKNIILSKYSNKQLLNKSQNNLFYKSIGNYKFSITAFLDIFKKKFTCDLILVRGVWQFQSALAYLNFIFNKTPYGIFVHGGLDNWFNKN